MKPDAFCYWLRGLLDGSPGAALTEAQVAEIRKHLDLVMADASGDEGVQREIRRVLNGPARRPFSNLIC